MNDQLKNLLEQQLRDAHTPDAVTWWPIAIGWWLLIMLITGVAIFGITKLIKHRRLNAHKKIAVYELNQHYLDWQTKQNDGDYLQAANAIIKRVCSHISLESNSLSGQAWVNYLNAFTKTDFSSETESALVDQLYQKSPAVNIKQTHTELRTWLVNHKSEKAAKALDSKANGA